MYLSVSADRHFRFSRLVLATIAGCVLAALLCAASASPALAQQNNGFPTSAFITPGDGFMTASLLQDPLPAPLQPGTIPELPATDVTGLYKAVFKYQRVDED